MDSLEEYYWITVAIPFFDEFIEQIQTRFNIHKIKFLQYTSHYQKCATNLRLI
jgi:hypothetical protein